MMAYLAIALFIIYFIYLCFKDKYESAGVRVMETLYLSIPVFILLASILLLNEIWLTGTATICGYCYYRYVKFTEYAEGIDPDFKPFSYIQFTIDNPKATNEELAEAKERWRREIEEQKANNDLIKARASAVKWYDNIKWIWAIGSMFAGATTSISVALPYLQMEQDPGVFFYVCLAPMCTLAFRQYMRSSAIKKRKKQKGNH